MNKQWYPRFKRWFENKYIVSYDQKKHIVEHNLNILPKIMPILIIFGVVNACSEGYRLLTGETTSKFETMYYTCYIIFPIISLIWSLINRKKHIRNLTRKNMPMYFSFLCIMGIILSLFVFTEDMFNAILVFASLVTISPILFYLEPIFYNFVLIITVVCLTPSLMHSITIYNLLNFYLYVFIMYFLSFYKWDHTKRNFEANRINENHAKQLDKELMLASNVQNSFYQHQMLNLDGWDIDFYYKAMSGVTGDLFDFFYTNKTLDGFCIFDVSGHGVSSGLVTMLTRTIITRQFTYHPEQSLDNIMYRINAKYEEQRGNIENYMSGILFRVKDDKIEMVNAAHPYPFIYRAAEKKVKLYEDTFSTRGTAIGLSSMKPCFILDTVDFSKNDEIILYTDGITEALNKNREEYGYERFQKVLQKNISKSVSDQIKAVVADVSAFVGDESPSDDITLLVLKRK